MLSRINKINWLKYTPFQQRVLKLVARIPKGQTLTYGQIAGRLGNIHFARAVGRALASNQDAPVIPCHRVVAQKGLGGYSARGGIKRKFRLLKLEGVKSININMILIDIRLADINRY